MGTKKGLSPMVKGTPQEILEEAARRERMLLQGVSETIKKPYKGHGGFRGHHGGGRAKDRVWSPERFIEWQEAMGVTGIEVSQLLDRTTAAVSRYRRDGCNLATALACQALYHRFRHDDPLDRE